MKSGSNSRNSIAHLQGSPPTTHIISRYPQLQLTDKPYMAFVKQFKFQNFFQFYENKVKIQRQAICFNLYEVDSYVVEW